MLNLYDVRTDEVVDEASAFETDSCDFAKVAGSMRVRAAGFKGSPDPHKPYQSNFQNVHATNPWSASGIQEMPQSQGRAHHHP